MMQAISINHFPRAYDEDMQRGRPSQRPRCPFGDRLYAARAALGLSQAKVAERLGITQTAYADWERYPVALRPDQVAKLTEILKIPIEQLYGNGREKRQSGGPVGKARRAFEGVSQLPKRQQQKIVEVVEAFVAQHADTK
jgi:transcriptional regulator with XRE-family HTH domain